MNTIECKLIKTHMKNTRNQNLYSTIKYYKCSLFHNKFGKCIHYAKHQLIVFDTIASELHVPYHILYINSYLLYTKIFGKNINFL